MAQDGDQDVTISEARGRKTAEAKTDCRSTKDQKTDFEERNSESGEKNQVGGLHS
jgi:hypothetical protein